MPGRSVGGCCRELLALKAESSVPSCQEESAGRVLAKVSSQGGGVWRQVSVTEQAAYLLFEASVELLCSGGWQAAAPGHEGAVSAGSELGQGESDLSCQASFPEGVQALGEALPLVE